MKENEKEIEFSSNEEIILDKRENEKKSGILNKELELSVLERIQMIRSHIALLDLVPTQFNENTNVYQFRLSELLDIITKTEENFGLCSVYTSDDENSMLRIFDIKNKESISFLMYTGSLLKENVDINSIFVIHDICKRMLYQNAYNISVKIGVSPEMILSEEDFIISELKKMLGPDINDFLNKMNVVDFKGLSFETLKATYEVMKKDYEEKQKK